MSSGRSLGILLPLAIVTDFGLSKYLNEYGFALPDKQYMLHVPPERFEFNVMSKFSDVYQAGLTLYRMCNGDKFFKNQLSKLEIESSNDLAESISKGKFGQMKGIDMIRMVDIYVMEDEDYEGWLAIKWGMCTFLS